jgi:integral membrane sensor domain MASE1
MSMVLWWIMNVVGLLVVAPLVIFLANRVIRPGREINAYADDILVHGVGITAALEPVPALATTRDEVAEITGHAVRYVTALRRLV